MSATATADVIVIGAGVMGSSIALDLARAGRSVTVIDKASGAGFGSTSASSGIIRFNYSTWDGVVCAWESYHRWLDWAGHLGVDSGKDLARFHRVGMVMLDAPAVPSRRTIELFERAGIRYEHWDSSTLLARIPGVDAGSWYPPKPVDSPEFTEDAHGELGGLFTPDAGYVDDTRLAAANLADAAARAGVTFRFKQLVTALDFDGSTWTVSLASGDRLVAPVVVNAGGPWSSGLNRLAGVDDDFTISLRPMRQEVHQVRAPQSLRSTDGSPVIGDLDLGTYMRPAAGGNLLVGGTEPECDPLEWIDDPDAASLLPTSSAFEAQVLRAARRFPELGVPSQPSGIAGVYDVSDDWIPVYDRTSVPGFYLAAGTSGNQFKNAPIVGSLMAALIDACESGHDHDADPVRYVGTHTGLEVNLGAFSRRRPRNADSSGTVMG